MLGDRPVSAYRVTLIARGSVCTEMRYELDFANGGYYSASIRLVDRVETHVLTPSVLYR
ncbi:MAG: hypothetical protein BWY76_01231 [bacterium ADurb.Bin429]|nr:MAG: hypothetical protein BWY76_01231 [bacterium ADurb.Bin429]